MKKMPQYTRRVAKVFDYIDDNLESNLTLNEVAKVAHYSPFHFHRIFKAITSEPLNSYITRKRIEKAATKLIREKDVSITELSSLYGFSSNAAFTKAFKSFYGIAPSKFRAVADDRYTKVSRLKNGSLNKVRFELYVKNVDNHVKWINRHAKWK